MPDHQSTGAPEHENGIEQLRQLTAFSRHLCTDSEAASRVRSSANPEEIVAIASDLGYLISVEALRSNRWELQADHWPWARESGRWRVQFFRQSSS
jgi:predicted ribosomally synthesized peptide with nif11-like leader